jgi:2-oxoglutarate ferredoxin oxidoreductase subunit gamma
MREVMKEKSNGRNDILMAGLGGMGVLSAGHILSMAALNKYRYVSWLPSYGVEKRGGLCECTVIFSNEEIPSPLIEQAGTVIIFDGSQLKTFEPRVRPGGTILVESPGLQSDHEAGSYRLIEISGMEVAVSIGAVQANNLILLGAYIAIAQTVPPDLVQQELKKRFETNVPVLKKNQEAFERGIELGRAIDKQGSSIR